MKIFLIWLLITSSCFAQLKATGVASWQDTVAGTSHGAFSPGGAPVLCYQNGGESWDFIDDDWVQVGDAKIWKSVKGNHRVYADSTGAAKYVVGAHQLITQTTHLVKFKLADSSWVTLAASAPDSVTCVGNRLRFHGIWPGVHKDLQNNPKVLQEFSERFVFTPEARDSFAGWGPWVGRRIGTVTELGVDSLNLTLSDVFGAFTIDSIGHMTDDWVKFDSAGVKAFYLKSSCLTTPDSIYHAMKVQKWLVKKSGKYYLVELFNPADVDQLPDTLPFWHHATFGNEAAGDAGQNIEKYFRGAWACSPASSGTIDSISCYIYSEYSGGLPVEMGVYECPWENVIDSIRCIDVTGQISVGPSVYRWEVLAGTLSGAVTAGGRYCIGVCAANDAGSNYVQSKYYVGADTMITDFAASGQEACLITLTSASTGERVSAFAYYTESGGPSGRNAAQIWEIPRYRRVQW